MPPRPALAAVLGIAGAALLAASGPVRAAGDAERGEYLFAAAGCHACHTDRKGKGPPLAGGRRLKTAFGTFVSPNITPDPETGIGKWSDADFVRALRFGRAPDGRHYFPAFPYASYTRMSEPDMLDLKAYLFARPPVARPNEPHALGPPFGWRWLVSAWKALYFTPGAYRPDPARDEAWNRGAYLVTALGHCAECHTPRDLLGGPKRDMAFAGAAQGPEGGVVPNITPDDETGIGKWSDADVLAVLKSGLLPDGDFVGSAMGEVVDETTGRLTDADRRAVVRYLRALEPVRHRVTKAK